MLRERIPLWFGIGALALLALLAGYVVSVFREADRLRVVVEAASDVVAASFEIERGTQDALAGSPASADEVAYAQSRLDRAFVTIDASGDPRFVAEAGWMRLQRAAALRLGEILGDRGAALRSGILFGRLRVSLSELSDTAVMLHRMAHDARANAIVHLFRIEIAVILVALGALAALIVLYQRYVSDRAAAERSLRRANDALTAHAEEKDQFLYAASHDLKEPLRMVTTYLDLVEVEIGRGASDRALKHFAFVHDGARRMRRLLDDLLAATLAERPRGAPEEVDLTAEAEAIAAMFAEQLREAGGGLRIAALPRVRADRARVAQVLQNLVGNAIKYRDARRPLAIAIESSEDALDWTIAVRDNGQGIEPQHHGDIFRLFRRLHGAEIDGTGAGLAICKRIVESWGGRIWVESSAGAGSRFCFTLPHDRSPAKGIAGPR